MMLAIGRSQDKFPSSKHSSWTLILLLASLAGVGGGLSGCFGEKSSSALELQPGREIQVKLDLAAGWKVNESAPSRLSLLEGVEGKPIQEIGLPELRSREAKLKALESGRAYRLKGALYVCREKDSGSAEGQGAVCVRRDYARAVSVAEKGLSEVRIALTGES